jgi:hypothetical protein
MILQDFYDAAPILLPNFGFASYVAISLAYASPLNLSLGRQPYDREENLGVSL